MNPNLREKTTFSFDEIPNSTSFEAGYLVTKNSSWRTVKPIVDNAKCVGCKQCYLYCPDGVISIKDGKISIDYDFCKGCGICRKICKPSAITMEEEK